jgi:hypothetical protein
VTQTAFDVTFMNISCSLSLGDSVVRVVHSCDYHVVICYGRLTVVSDLDSWGIVLKSSNKSGVNAILYRRKYN